MEERRKSVPFCRKVSAFVDADISKARTTKGDVSWKGSTSGYTRHDKAWWLVSGSAMQGGRRCIGGSLCRWDEPLLKMLLVHQTGQRTGRWTSRYRGRVLCPPTNYKDRVQRIKLWETDYPEGETIETFSCNITQAALWDTILHLRVKKSSMFSPDKKTLSTRWDRFHSKEENIWAAAFQIFSSLHRRSASNNRCTPPAGQSHCWSQVAADRQLLISNAAAS